MKKKYFFSFLVSTIVLSLASCKKDQPKAVTEPSVVTNDIDPASITDNKALFSIKLIADGNSPIKAFGYCWSRSNPNPTIDDAAHTATYNNPKVGFTYNSQLDKLNPYDTYYVRAYATNEAGKTAYGETKTFKTLSGTFTDNDGNVYHTITIGNQVWMQENWKDPVMGKTAAVINKITSDKTAWSTTTLPAFCWSENIEGNKKFGGLYNWNAISHPDFAPNGWHVPAEEEWNELIAQTGGFQTAGIKLKDKASTDNGGTWPPPNTDVTNESGFTALRVIYRDPSGFFLSQFSVSAFWTSTKASANSVKICSLYYTNDVKFFNDLFNAGYLIRLIRDTPANN
jgi:uncharacterized protein (TIGR02145 family)